MDSLPLRPSPNPQSLYPFFRRARTLTACVFLTFIALTAQAQLGSRVVVGYFHNWNNASAPYIRLANVDSRYNVINIAFAVPAAPGDMTMTFAPLQQSKAEFMADIQTLHAQGRRVQISIGGADAPVELNTAADVTKFVNSMKSIINEYGFDGLDIDLEATSVILNSGDNNFKSPTTPKIINLIAASREVTNYFRGQGKDFWLTAAPETQYVQGGYGFYGTAYGGYLPVLYGIRDLLTFVHVQYYNTGSQTGLDDRNYSQATPDFIVAMTDMLLKGFPVARNTANMFPALRQDQVAFGLPATGTGAAPAGGYVALADINKALNYLVKGISYGGQYVTNATYPNLRGIMTWSANWDATTGNTFAANAYNFFSGLGGNTNVAPTASITSPSNGAAFTAPASITINATATDSDGSVAKVEFYNGSTKLGEDTSSPYTYTWSGVAVGTYPLRVVATDNQGATGSSANISVNVTSGSVTQQPYNGVVAAIPGKVEAEFYDLGGQGVAYNDLSTGNSGTALRADDVDLEASTDTGGGYNIGWIQPGEWVEYTVNVTSATALNLEARVASTSSGTFHVELNGTNISGTITVPNTGGWQTWQTVTVTTPALTTGQKILRLVMDNGEFNLNFLNFTTTTTTNPPPTASITAPSAGATFTAPASINISANASDNGSVAQVAFYNGATLLGTDTSSPYSYSWTNVTAGTYNLTAIATDNQGATGTSSAVSITVNGGTSGCTDPAWVATQAYLQGARVSHNNKIYEAKWWTQNENPETNSSEWAVWKIIGPCGGTSNNNPTVSLTAPAAGATFTAPASVTISANAGDSDGTITKVAFYNGSTLLNEDTSSPYAYTWSNVAAGNHILSAIATDNAGATATSAAVTISVTSTPGNAAPAVSLTAPAAGATFTAPASVTISANASDSDGTIAKVAFYQGSTLLNEDTSSPYSYSWTGVVAGTYSITARATDNAGATTTSAAVSITVNGNTSDNCNVPAFVAGTNYAAGAEVKNNGKKYKCEVAGWCSLGGAYEPGVGWAWDDAWQDLGECTVTGIPTVALTSPTAGANYAVGAAVSIAASASDSNGTITQVVFVVDGSVISTDTSSPYSVTWTATQGFHTIVARATDNSGNTVESSPVTISGGTTNSGDLPARILSGYWHSWGGGVPFIKLRDVSPKWDVINISFAEPVTVGSTNGQMKFVLPGATSDYTVTDFKNDIRTLQSRGKKIVISVGGYEGYFSLTSTSARDTFVGNMKAIIDEYGFDGMDIDLEQSSLELNTGDADFRNPTSPKVVHMISAIRAICDYKGANFILSFAPEAFYLQLGYQWYAGIHASVDRRAGVYIPVIHALRDKLTYVQAQLYNQPAVMALDNVLYSSGNGDYLVSMSDMLLKGFNVGGNTAYFFPPLRPDQVLFGVPASASAAGSGQVTNQQLQQAFTYMTQGTSFGGQYRLTSTYPTLRGIMTWSINWDAYQNGNSFVNANRTYLDGLSAAATAESVAAASEAETAENVTALTADNTAGITLYPNPGNSSETQTLALTSESDLGNTSIRITSADGVTHYNTAVTNAGTDITLSLPVLPKGLYMVRIQSDSKTVTKRYLVK